MRFLCIFAIPRTGSSHLNKLLKSCRGVDAKSELFHGSARMRFSEGELAQLRDRAGDMVLDATKFAKWRRRHPAGTLKAIYEGGAPRIVAFKVFQNHLKPEKIQSELLVRDDTGFAVLTRRPIECYISGLKAKSMSRFGAIDTTAIKPTLSAGDFADWAERNRRWYGWIQDALEARGQPYAKLSFEEHLDGLSGEESLARILPLFETIGFPAMQASQRIVEGQRQDKEVRYQDRVANWDEFAAAASSDPESASLFEWVHGGAMMDKRALVLFSGGQDSTTCLAWALERFAHVETVGFDYGQRHAAELTARPHILAGIRAMFPRWAGRLGADHLLPLEILKTIGGTALTDDRRIEMGAGGLPNTFVPGRNILFLTAAAALAYRRGIADLVGGMCETDFSGYPDCRERTIRAVQEAINLGMDVQFAIHTPLMAATKAQTWALAKDLGGEPLVGLIVEETVTCYEGDRAHRHAWGYGCGRCPACDLRAKGFAEYAPA